MRNVNNGVCDTIEEREDGFRLTMMNVNMASPASKLPIVMGFRLTMRNVNHSGRRRTSPNDMVLD